MKFFILLLILQIFKRGDCTQDYVVDNDAIKPLDGEGETLVDFNNLHIYERKHYINGSIIFREDLGDDDYKFEVTMFTSPNGDGIYKQMPWGVPKVGVCEGFKKFYKEFVQGSFDHGTDTNIPFIDEDGLCPIPAGEYYFLDILLDTDNWPNQMPRGSLQIVINFYKDDVKAGGMTATLNISDDTR